MTAVFTDTQREYEALNLYPSSNFKRIKRREDSFGITFTSAIVFTDYHNTEKDIREAFAFFKANNRKLFK